MRGSSREYQPQSCPGGTSWMMTAMASLAPFSRTMPLGARRLLVVFMARTSRRLLGPEWCLRPLFQGYIRRVVLADVDLLRPEDAVILELLQPVGQPAGHAGDGKDRREQVAGNAQGIVDNARIEIDVWVNALGAQDAG